MADISDIKKIAKELCLMNIANGIIELKEETVSNLDYLYNVLSKEKELREKDMRITGDPIWNSEKP